MKFDSDCTAKTRGDRETIIMTRGDVYSNALSAGNCSVIRCAFYILHTSYAPASTEISPVQPGGVARRGAAGRRKSESAFK